MESNRLASPSSDGNGKGTSTGAARMFDHWLWRGVMLLSVGLLCTAMSAAVYALLRLL